MLSTVDTKYFKMAVGHHNIGKETNVDITARCIACGDGKKNNSKRLHLYEKNGTTLVHCFNGDCDVHFNVWNFLNKYKPELIEQYKRESFATNINDLRDSFSAVKLKKEENLPAEEKDSITYHDLTSMFTPIEQSVEALEYIKSRHIPYNPSVFGLWYYGTQDLQIGDKRYRTSDSVVIPLYKNGKMYGFYSRKLKEKSFATYNPEQNVGYKVWNWFNVDLNLPVYIFESIFDAISSGKKNIIALMGAKLPEERLREIKHPIFCLDNDKTGMLNGINYATRGYSVFIIPYNIKEKDMNEIVKNHPFDMDEFIDMNTYKGIAGAARLKMML